MTNKVCGCGTALANRNVSGKCAPCSIRYCPCGNTLCMTNRTGNCRSCNTRLQNADPEHKARQIAGCKARFAADPELGRINAARSQANLKRWRDANPGELRRITLKGMAAMTTPEARSRQRESLLRRTRSWCSPDEHTHYRQLIAKCVPAAEARAMVVAMRQTEARRGVRDIERNMHIREKRRQRDAY